MVDFRLLFFHSYSYFPLQVGCRFRVWQNVWELLKETASSLSVNIVFFLWDQRVGVSHWTLTKVAEIPCADNTTTTTTRKSRTNSSFCLSHPFSPPPPARLFSFCPKEGHFCPMGENNIDGERWVIDWGERTGETVDMQQTATTFQTATCVCVFRLTLRWYESCELHTTLSTRQTCRGSELDVGAPHLLCGGTWALPLATNLYMLGNWCNSALF